MEFIRGAARRGAARIRRQPSSGLRERLELMVKICEAVHHAHQRGLIHRDLKPGNIIVDETGQPKILDFGVARVTDAPTPPGMLGATPAKRKRYAEAEPLLISGYEGMAIGKAVNPNAASRMSREQVTEALLQLYRDTGNTVRGAELERKLRN